MCSSDLKKPEEMAIIKNEVRTQWTQYVVEETLFTLSQVWERAADEGIDVTAEAVYLAPQTWPLSDKEAIRTVPKEKYRNYPTYNYATHVAIVGVDEATGRVDLLRMIAAHDCGVPINPQQIRGQIIGSGTNRFAQALSRSVTIRIPPRGGTSSPVSASFCVTVPATGVATSASFSAFSSTASCASAPETRASAPSISSGRAPRRNLASISRAPRTRDCAAVCRSRIASTRPCASSRCFCDPALAASSCSKQIGRAHV